MAEIASHTEIVDYRYGIRVNTALPTTKAARVFGGKRSKQGVSGGVTKKITATDPCS